MSFEPELGASSFTCPHCRAHAQQDWFDLYVNKCTKDHLPDLYTEERIGKELDSAGDSTYAVENIILRSESLISKSIISSSGGFEFSCEARLDNLYVSKCLACNCFCVWRADELIFPEREFCYLPNADLPEDAAADFLEAASIARASPRGAAALLRLAIRKICVSLGEPGENLNEDIGSLVRKGLDARVQEALDAVRVVGKNAVLPGALDARDDLQTVSHLFELINIIADSLISQPKRIRELHEKLPAGAREAVVKREHGARAGGA